mmetsp:Transcript_4638/g.7973  ORF Transcript_4638/g.7973 Transcript_4638/m.7973 type:complete len:293 (-) Transcript_4638:302-1180(-)
MEEEGQQQPTTNQQQSSLDILLNLDKQAADLKAQHKNNASYENVVYANWARSEIQSARSSALATKSIFTHCFVAHSLAASPIRCVYAILMLFLAVVIQVVVPFIILITRQPIIDLPNACPNQSSFKTKIIGFALSFYFVFQTLQLCLNKLRGLNFLHSFVDLGFGRSLFLKLGILSQLLGMAGAGGAQYMLNIGNADGAFIVLVLQSLAMNFCLTVDQNLMGHKQGIDTSARVSAVSKDHLLCNGVGIGEDGESIPQQSFDGIKQMNLRQNFILVMISCPGLAWVIALTYCM